jgi:hypothetical protein
MARKIIKEAASLQSLEVKKYPWIHRFGLRVRSNPKRQKVQAKILQCMHRTRNAVKISFP